MGIAENVGHAITFKILTNDTKRVVFRSNVRSGNDPRAPNLRLNFHDGEYKSTNPKEFIKSVYFKRINQDQSLMVIKPEDMVGRTFLSDPMNNGGRQRWPSK